MSDTITYSVESTTITFQYPTLTVTETPVLAGRGDFAVAVRKIYAMRAIIMATVYEDLDKMIEWVHQVLSAPGGTLTINYNGMSEGALTVSPENDLRDGPRPRAVAITKIYGSKSALVRWEIETVMFPTAAGYTGAEGRWVDLVYTVSSSVDRNFFATRTIAGVLTLNRNFSVQPGFSADSFRLTLAEYFTLPPKSRGFWQRESQRFVASADDTLLNFTIVDKQSYTWLPYGVTSGDIRVATSSENNEEKGMVGSIVLSGYFQSMDVATRSDVQGAVLEMLNLFANTAVFLIQEQSRVQGRFFLIEEDKCSFTHHWRSNRIDFNLAYRILGQYAGGLIPNITYTTGIVLAWLARLTRESSSTGPPVDGGPYGTSWAAGRTGEDTIASPIIIDFAEKMAKSRTFGYPSSSPAAAPSDLPQGGEAPSEERPKAPAVLSFHQRFDYKLDMGMRHFPVLTENYNDIIQQVRSPQMFLIVSGEVESPDFPPGAPLPPYPLVSADFTGGGEMDGTPQAVLLSASIKAQEPTNFGKYKLRWQYVLKLYNVVIPSNLEAGLTLRWPWTPNYLQDWASDGPRLFESFVHPGEM